jgi:hypothetical protein
MEGLALFFAFGSAWFFFAVRSLDRPAILLGRA